jgi:ATP-dependent NAD(P)H-hydrate dehydratase
LSNLLNCTIVQKGQVDQICYHGTTTLECDIPGSLKRVGGQGDSLTGMMGAFLCWGMGAYKNKLYDTPDNLDDEQIISLSCLAGCTTTRLAGHLAYQKYGRSMLTSNLHEFISEAFRSL